MDLRVDQYKLYFLIDACRKNALYYITVQSVQKKTEKNITVDNRLDFTFIKHRRIATPLTLYQLYIKASHFLLLFLIPMH